MVAKGANQSFNLKGAYCDLAFDAGFIFVRYESRVRLIAVSNVEAMTMRRPAMPDQLWRFGLEVRHDSPVDVPFHESEWRAFLTFALFLDNYHL